MRALIFLILLIWAGAASPQSWEVRTSDNGGYATATAAVFGTGMGITCHARSLQNLPLIQTGWHESTIAPPYHFHIGFSQALIRPDPYRRNDITLFVDQTGYRLPTIQWSELVGEWDLILPVTDAMFTAMQSASRQVLQIGSETAWEFPTQDMGAALQAVRQYCAPIWAQRGYPAPAGFAPVPETAPPSGGFEIPTQVQSFANRQCNGPARIGASALQAGDLDRDGQPDVVMDWSDVLCPGETRSGFCGAANCSINVFLSSRGYANSYGVLGVGVRIRPHPSGLLGLEIGGTASVCAQIDCFAVMLWNGTEFAR